MNKRENASVRADLQQYLLKKNTLVPPEFSKVVADASQFVEAVVRDGFEKAFAQSPAHVDVASNRPFIEVADALVHHHIRFMRQTDCEIARKSLLDVYTHIAGSGYIFEPTKKTRFVRSLRQSEPKKFAGMLLSLHLYNLICARIQDDVRKKLPDAKSVEVYLLNVEGICRDAVTDSLKVQAAYPDERWVMAVIRSAEMQLRGPEITSNKAADLSIPTGYTK